MTKDEENFKTANECHKRSLSLLVNTEDQLIKIAILAFNYLIKCQYFSTVSKIMIHILLCKKLVN